MQSWGMILDLASKAQEDLSFIRSAMSRVANVSSVSGLGGMLMGGVALLAALSAQLEVSLTSQLAIWLYAAPPAVLLGTWATIRKARSAPVHWDPVRRFLLCLVPVMAVCALLTWQLWQYELWLLIAPLWMLLYGCGVLAAGTYAVASVSYVGVCFLSFGLLAMFSPPSWHNALLAASFGGVHIVFGWRIYRHHGG